MCTRGDQTGGGGAEMMKGEEEEKEGGEIETKREKGTSKGEEAIDR